MRAAWRLLLRHRARAALLLLPLLLAACGVSYPEPSSCGLRLAAELPVAMAQRVPVVSATINRQPVKLILDTGAQSMVLTKATVERLRLRPDVRSAVTVRGTGGESRTWRAGVVDFTLGRLPVPDQEAVVLPFALPQVGDVKPDGLLGVDVLSHFEVDLDVPHGRVGLYAGQPCPGEKLPLPGSVAEMDAPRLRQGRLVVQVVLDGQPLNALLDTGTDRSIVMTQAAMLTGLTRADLAADRTSTLHGAGPRPTQARIHRFHLLSIAGEHFPGPFLQVTDRQADEDDMILGMDYMAHRRIWLAYRRGKVFVQRAGPGPMAAR